MIFTATSDHRFDLGDRTCPCALGKGGVVRADHKREGDGCSPLGIWPIRAILYRPDQAFAALMPKDVAHAPIQPSDGWCDEPQDPSYNRKVVLPYPASTEHLWREDRVYDVVVVLGHNDDPPVPFMGSAIFLHLARPDYSPTAGCVALSAADMEAFLTRVRPGDSVRIAL
ncbi:MAG: L,D-transpeptidase family protein [Alphaproteobacteria bacterium]